MDPNPFKNIQSDSHPTVGSPAMSNSRIDSVIEASKNVGSSINIAYVRAGTSAINAELPSGD